MNPQLYFALGTTRHEKIIRHGSVLDAHPEMRRYTSDRKRLPDKTESPPIREPAEYWSRCFGA